MLLAHPHHQADDAEVAQRVGADGELQLGREQRLGVHRQQRRDDLVGRVQPVRRDDADGAAARGDDARDLGRRADGAAAGADRRGERVDEHLVAAVDRAHDLAGRAVARAGHAPRARPQVRRGQVVVATVELRVQQRLPEVVPELAAAGLAQPLLERDLLEVVVAALDLAARDEAGEARAIDGAQAREGRELLQRRHRGQLAVAGRSRRRCAGSGSGPRRCRGPSARPMTRSSVGSTTW